MIWNISHDLFSVCSEEDKLTYNWVLLMKQKRILKKYAYSNHHNRLRFTKRYHFFLHFFIDSPWFYKSTQDTTKSKQRLELDLRTVAYLSLCLIMALICSCQKYFISFSILSRFILVLILLVEFSFTI